MRCKLELEKETLLAAGFEMDWIDPRYSINTEVASLAEGRKKEKKGGRGKKVRRTQSRLTAPSAKGKSRKKSAKPLSSQVDAALAQPLDVWTAAFDHALSGLKWPTGCSVENSFLWSAVMQEQAEVLVRAGMSAKKLSAIVAEHVGSSEQDKAQQRAEVVGLMDQSLESLAFRWLDTADAYPFAALGVAALAWYIPEAARRPAADWLTQWVHAAVDRISIAAPDPDESVLCGLVLHCELPLLIGVATAASKRTALDEASRAMDNLAEYLERSEDNVSGWLAHGATYLRAALACVLRCRVLANSLGLRKWFPPQQSALAKLLQHAARWARPDGTQLLAAGNSSPRAMSIWEALVKQTNKPKSTLNAMALNGLVSLSKPMDRKQLKPKSLPALSFYSDDAMCAVVQSDWRQKGCRVAVDFSDTDMFIEALGPRGAAILVGEWTCSVACDGQAELQLDQWGESCWFSDDDVDYLELEAKFGQHARVQRQVVLLRSERMLLVADALLCDRPGDWCLTSKLPLAADATFESNKKTTEGFIKRAGTSCLTMPIYLPEWHRQHTQGSVAREEGNLVVRHACSDAQRLYAPLLISLCNRHAKKPYTWRHLTVGEDLRIVRPDEAVAFRVQTGKDQLVFYRTLAPATRRTALGMHTLSDFYAGRFDASQGEVETLIEVEADVAS
ncbi:MAG: hypothetical protein R3C53_24410 [Pirellulaceae bacterium]